MVLYIKYIVIIIFTIGYDTEQFESDLLSNEQHITYIINKYNN